MTQHIGEKASGKDLLPCVFRAGDIDFDSMLIRAKVWMNDEWVERIIEYPEIILDRIQLRGVRDAEYIYEELMESEFLNKTNIKTMTRFGMFNILHQIESLKPHTPDVQLIEKISGVIRFLETHSSTRIQKNDYSESILWWIDVLGNSKFEVTKYKRKNMYNGIQLRNELKADLKKWKFFIQERSSFIYSNKPFTIRANWMLDAQNNWTCVSQQPVFRDDQCSEELSAVLSVSCPGNVDEVLKQLEETGEQFAKAIFEVHGEDVPILTMDFGLDGSCVKLDSIVPNSLHHEKDDESFAIGIVQRVKGMVERREERR